MAQIIKPESTLRSRSAELSDMDVVDLIRGKNFYELSLNPRADCLPNLFELGNVQGDKIVIDHAYSLVWQQSGSSKSLDFVDAEKYIDGLNRKGFADFYDWRLPTLEEAMSLIKSRLQINGSHIHPVFNSLQKWIWTSDTVKDERRAWVVYFNFGSCYTNFFWEQYYVRAVRTDDRKVCCKNNSAERKLCSQSRAGEMVARAYVFPMDFPVLLSRRNFYRLEISPNTPSCGVGPRLG